MINTKIRNTKIDKSSPGYKFIKSVQKTMEDPNLEESLRKLEDDIYCVDQKSLSRTFTI